MMRLNKLFLAGLMLTVLSVGCKKDDVPAEVVIRDVNEVKLEDEAIISAYLETHFYNYEDFENPVENFNHQIVFDTISGENSGKTPLSEDPKLESRSYTKNDVDYTYYILKVREGVGEHPTFADSTFQNYKGQLLAGRVFDNTTNPVWFDHPGTRTKDNAGIAVTALTDALTEFGEASNYVLNDDNTVMFTNDYGIGAIITPSGLAYFSNTSPAIPAYSPLIFSFRLYRVNQADHDRDGIPSYLEDLNDNKFLADDDSDKDKISNYLDADDDNDGSPTRDEIIINADGTITFPDANGDGIPDYLDPETFS